MENRTKIETKVNQAVFFEAVVKHKTEGFEKTLTKSKLELLQSDLDIWLKCGNYELISADKVERVLVKLIA
jgi:hypothetical protein